MSNKEVVSVSTENTQFFPNFASPMLFKTGGARKVNLGNFENEDLQAGIEVECEVHSAEEITKTYEFLGLLVQKELDRQEAEVRGRKEAKEIAAKEVEIKVAEETAEKMKNVPIYVWEILTKHGQLKVSNDPNFQLKCPRCGSPLALRHGKYGDFYGCTGYQANGCQFAINEGHYNEFMAKANELISVNVPHPEKLLGKVEGQYISYNTDKCYEPLTNVEIQGREIAQTLGLQGGGTVFSPMPQTYQDYSGYQEGDPLPF